MPTSENDAGGWARIVTRRDVMVTLAGLMIVLLTLILGRVNSTVVLITSSNDSIPFPDVEASFAQKVPGAGIAGLLSAASPSNACEPLQVFNDKQATLPAFLLIERGDCNFVAKVQYAQDAGYAAAIVYDNQDGRDLVTMSGNGLGIQIPAVFVSKQAGDILLQSVGDANARLYMLPAFENTAWSVMAVSLISLLAVSAVLSTFFFVRRQRLRRAGSRQLLSETKGLSSGELKALPIAVFNPKDNANSENCIICLEEYASGEKLRVLPCNHEFHVPCIDQWLTTQRPFCPICKRDVHCKTVKPPASENTPLLNSIARHMGSSIVTETSSTGSELHSAGDAC